MSLAGNGSSPASSLSSILSPKKIILIQKLYFQIFKHIFMFWYFFIPKEASNFSIAKHGSPFESSVKARKPTMFG